MVSTKEPVNRLTAAWEEVVIPPIKSFMEKDGFSPFEVEEYLQQIRSQLAGNNEQQAKGIVLQIVGDTGLQINFPSAASASFKDKPSLRIEDFKLESQFTVSSAIVPSEIHDKNWVSMMDKTVGQTGTVKGVDHQAGMVLLQFYNGEMSALTEWWYPVKMLEKAERHAGDRTVQGLNRTEVENRLGDVSIELIHLYARKAVLSLVLHSPIHMNGSLNVENVLNLMAYENVSTSLLTIPPQIGGVKSQEDRSSRFYVALEDRLMYLYNNNQSSGLTNCLVNQAIQCFDAASDLITTGGGNGTLYVSSKTGTQGPLIIQHEHASCMILLFDRANTSISSNSGTTFNFYSDEAGTEIVKTYAEKSKFVPFAVPTGKLWLRVVTPSSSSNSGRSGYKYKFTAVPIHPKLGLAFWIVSFLLEKASPLIDNIDEMCIKLYHSIVDYIYVSTAPSSVKESAFYLLSHLIQSIKDNKIILNPLNRLIKLKDEMVGLYEVISWISMYVSDSL